MKPADKMYQQFIKAELTLLYNTCSLYLTQIRFNHFFITPFHSLRKIHIFFVQFDYRFHSLSDTCSQQNPYNQKMPSGMNGRMLVTIILIQSTQYPGESN